MTVTILICEDKTFVRIMQTKQKDNLLNSWFINHIFVWAKIDRVSFSEITGD